MWLITLQNWLRGTKRELRVYMYVNAKTVCIEAMKPDTDFTRLGWKKAHVSEVASLFKLFFREMPDSLLQHELYDCFISVYGTFSGSYILYHLFSINVPFSFANQSCER